MARRLHRSASMRLTALLVFGALSVFAVGCAAEDTSGNELPRPSSAKTDPSKSKGGTGTAESDTTTEGDVAQPVTPATGPVTPPTTPTPAPAAPPVPPTTIEKPILCLTDQDSVTQSYRLALQRQPDPGGLVNWVSAIQNGDTRLGVLQKIIGSAEFAQIHANLTDQEFVSYCYNSFLTRQPDPGGMQTWLGALQSGESRASVAQAFTNSAEFQNPGSNTAAACYF